MCIIGHGPRVDAEAPVRQSTVRQGAIFCLPRGYHLSVRVLPNGWPGLWPAYTVQTMKATAHGAGAQVSANPYWI